MKYVIATLNVFLFVLLVSLAWGFGQRLAEVLL